MDRKSMINIELRTFRRPGFEIELQHSAAACQFGVFSLKFCINRHDFVIELALT
jgi:hypothetical protein